MTSEPKRAKYTGVYKHTFGDAGFGVWVPTEWQRLELANGNPGALFVPDPADMDTCLLVEKVTLDYSVEEDDIEALREGFAEGLKQLDITEIEWQKETITKLFKGWDARFVYRDGDVERKRWVRTMFWGDAQLTFIAQGKDVETYDYYAGMFYNIMMTFEIM
ncbi:MAG: hypothetical protein ABFD20_05905 [Anaerolineales bacterium]